MDTDALKIYTDGSAFDNPGKRCGWAMELEFPEKLYLQNEVISGSVEETTINRMELTAVIEAILCARQKSLEHKIQRTIILTDSQYVVENYRRAHFWRKDKWCNRYGKPVENSDLWKKFLSVIANAGTRIEINWIKGKSSEITKRVDKAAKTAAKAIIKRKDQGYIKSKISKPTSKGSAILYDKGEGPMIIRIYSYIETKKGDLVKVKFEICSSDKKVLPETKYFAYYHKKNGITEISRHHLYFVSFNEDIHFPIFTVEKQLE